MGSRATDFAHGRRSTARRLAAVLALLVEEEDVGVSDVCGALGMAKSTAHRLLQDLTAAELAGRDEGDRYRLGPEFFALCARARGRARLEALALPELRALARRTGQSAQLVVRQGVHGICREVVAPDRPILLHVRRGARAPLTAGAACRLLVAHAEPERLRAALVDRLMTASGGGPPLDRQRWQEGLAQARRTGLASSFGEIAAGTAELAVPVWDGRGRVVAALSLMGLEAAFRDAARRQAWLANLRASATRISRGMGHRPGEPKGDGSHGGPPTQGGGALRADRSE
jgi:DNA-binding IclR family transcriptional regulator